MGYQPVGKDPHWREEELQWARILETGDATRGMALIYLQKACAALHELQPAVRAGAVVQAATAFYRERMAARVGLLVEAMKANGLGALDVASELEALLEAIRSAPSVQALADLADDLHDLGHRLCDALERPSGQP